MYPLTEINQLSPEKQSETVRIRAWVFAKKDCGRVLFVVLRDGLDTVQAIVLKNKETAADALAPDAYNALRKVENESFIEVMGTIQRAQSPVLSCSQKLIELVVSDFTILSRSVVDLPITLKEATPTEAQKQEAYMLPSVAFCKRLDNRVLDLRTELSQAIFRINDGLLYVLQTHLRKQGFVEIKTAKLIGGASEGGADVFKLDYFGKPACLAQSPQLYKQMVLVGGFKRVFEIGPVFRAENSNTHRHLTEFVGVDLEMVVDTSYMEVVRLLYQLFVDVFDTLHRTYNRELEIVRTFFDVPQFVLAPELVVLEFKEAVALLRAQGSTIADLGDFTTEDEKKLGVLVKERYGTDLYVVTRYPSNVRPFYTMPDPEDLRYSYTYDFMLRGEEILSGAQRIHDYQMLCARVEALGIDKTSISHYLEAFKYGAPPHAGAGIGLERVLKYFLGLPDIRYCNLFPRDPKRLYP